MNRSDIIAQVLVRSSIYETIEDAKQAIVATFNKEFPQKDYTRWDLSVPPGIGEALINGIGIKKESAVSISYFIMDLETILKNNEPDEYGGRV